MRLRLDDRRFSVGSVVREHLGATKFDLGIYSVGYEKRSSFIPSSLRLNTSALVGIDLGGAGKCSYNSNLATAKERKDRLVRKSSLGLQEDRDSLLPLNTNAPLRIFIDVSSMDRRTLSIVIYRVLMSLNSASATIYFLYAPASFQAPAPEQLPVDFSGPMNALLTSAPRDPRFPTILFLGLGYELGLALGVVEQFEPARVLAYMPRGSDKRFDQEVGRVNAALFADQKYVTRVPYNLMAPVNLFIDLKDRILSLRDRAKIIVVPLGPKIFSSIAIILGYLYTPDITVWRVSSVIDWTQAEREAEGSIIGFRLEVASPPVFNTVHDVD